MGRANTTTIAAWEMPSPGATDSVALAIPLISRKDAALSGSTVRLELPATSGYLVLARAAAAAMCAQLDYPLDRLEDVKLAVDEGCTLLLSDTDPDQMMTLVLNQDGTGRMQISMAATTRQGKPPKKPSFAWTVLSALVDRVSANTHNGRLTISLEASRGDVSVTS